MIDVTLNGLVFAIPTRGERDWQDLTDWIIEVNETLATSSTNTNIPAGTTDLVDGSPINLYTVNAPQDNSHIIFEYGVYRRTTGTGATSLSVTGTLTLAYNTLTGVWAIAQQANGNPEVVFDVTSNVIRATATALTGTPDTSVIFYSGRIIKA